MNKLYFFSFYLLILIASCQSPAIKPLPILGNRDVNASGDTIYPQIPSFSFMDQDSQIVNNATFAGKAYVADFFFIHCPTICPKVKAQCKRLYDHFAQEPNLLIISHSIDTKHDSVPALHNYAKKLGIDAKRWHLVTGEHDAIYGVADDYFSVAIVNPDAPGGFDHSGRLILVDPNRHVRAFCDGTNPEDVDRFMKKVDQLLQEIGTQK